MKREYDVHDAFAYLDGELAPAEVSTYEAALAADPTVEAQLTDARTARAAWAQSSEEAQPSDLDWPRIDRAVMQRIAHETLAPEPVDSLGWLWRLGRGAVFAGALAALVFGLYASYQALAPTPSEPAVAEAPAEKVSPETLLPEKNAGELIAAGKRSHRATVAAATLTLTPATVCKVVRKDAEATVIDMINGSATFDVAERAPGQVFQVRAGDVTVTVVGTRFTVSKDAYGKVAVHVDHGTVRVQRGAEPPSVLRDGESISMAPQDVAASKANPQPVPVPDPQPAPEPAPAPELKVQAPEKPAAPRKRVKPKKKPAPAPEPVVEEPEAPTPSGRRFIEINADKPEVTHEGPGFSDYPDLNAIVARIGKVSDEKSADDLHKWLDANPFAPLELRRKVGGKLARLNTLPTD